MRSLSNIVGGLSYVGCERGQQNGNRVEVELHSGKGDMVSGTSQSAGTVAVSLSMCTGLPNS